jgi:uncharacterized protein DUF1844
MTEEKKSFTVSDRRHFTPEGQAREVEERSPEPPRKPTAEAAPVPRGEAPRPAMTDEPDDQPAGGPYPLDFTGLLISLGTQAAMLLAGGDPDQGGPEPDPAGARAFITLLEVLQEKTEGRRTPEENQVLESLLFQLRMEYVSRTQVKGA